MEWKNKKPYIKSAIGLTLIFLAFQNMSLVEFSSLEISKVDEDARREQARELLGAYYRGSVAQKFEGQENLNYFIFKKVDNALSARFKPLAPDLVRAIISESEKFEFDPVFILAVIQTESTFNPQAKGTSGEIGLMQILPPTAEWIARKYKEPWRGNRSLYDPITNIRLGIRYFAHLRSEFDGTAYHYLPAYNMGPANMRRIERKIGSLDGNGKVMKREYAMRVIKNYSQIYKEMALKQKETDKIAKADEESAKR